MGVVETVKTFLWKIAVKKGVKGLVKGLVQVGVGTGAFMVLAKYGVEVDPEKLAAALLVLAYGGVEFIANVLKHKFGWKL